MPPKQKILSKDEVTKIMAEFGLDSPFEPETMSRKDSISAAGGEAQFLTDKLRAETADKFDSTRAVRLGILEKSDKPKTKDMLINERNEYRYNLIIEKIGKGKPVTSADEKFVKAYKGREIGEKTESEKTPAEQIRKFSGRMTTESKIYDAIEDNVITPAVDSTQKYLTIERLGLKTQEFDSIKAEMEDLLKNPIEILQYIKENNMSIEEFKEFLKGFNINANIRIE